MRWFGLTLLLLTVCGQSINADEPKLTVDPEMVALKGPSAVWSLQVALRDWQDQLTDRTRTAQFRSLTPEIVRVDERGVVRGLADGTGQVEVQAEGQTRLVSVTVSDTNAPRSLHFENDVIPILSKFGCNTSGCHGKAEGQNGFKLSVFGFDPEADHAALTQEGRGRRVFSSEPGQSLLLQKASGGLPHGGGVRIAKGTEEYALLAEWIAAGVPLGDKAAPTVASIHVSPRERVLSPRGQQPLRVVATYTDGRRVDVTAHSKFQSNNEGLGQVNESGLVTAGETPGDVAIMASYMGAVDLFRALVPLSTTVSPAVALPQFNFIDRFVDQKLAKLRIEPSGLCSDEDFLRRVALDLTGKLPTATEVRDFLADTRPDRRAQRVEILLRTPEFADFWALKWADVLRVDRQALGHKRAYAYYRWIREQFAQNRPYDDMSRDLLTATGPLGEAPAGALFKVLGQPGPTASAISQVFLGVRIECAQCHHHPFDRWSQHDYLGMHAFFTQISFKGSNESLVAAGAGGASVHPRTSEVVFAHALGTASPATQPEGDRRRVLAEWMTAPENPWFARNLANRVWAHFLGRGIVEPVDDFRLTNPPSNPELLDALAQEFVKSNFDLRQLMRTIIASRVYQSSVTPTATNRQADQNFSRMLLKRLESEVLLDAVCDTTGVPEKFPGVPTGHRAVQLWDSQVSHYFLKLFGRPTRVTSCECERSTEPSVAQVLHVMNSPELQAKLSHAGGRIAQLERTIYENGPLVDELYLTFYSRHPTAAEKTQGESYLQAHAADRRAATEDLAWSLLNTVEFIFNH